MTQTETPEQKRIAELERQLRDVRRLLELERRRFAFFIQYGERVPEL